MGWTDKKYDIAYDASLRNANRIGALEKWGRRFIPLAVLAAALDGCLNLLQHFDTTHDYSDASWVAFDIYLGTAAVVLGIAGAITQSRKIYNRAQDVMDYLMRRP